MYRLTCGHQAPAPKLTSSQLYHGWGKVFTGDLLLTCPEGHGLVGVDTTPAPVEPQDPALHPDPWAA